MESVAIIIRNYNGFNAIYKGKPILPECIERVLRTDYKNKRVILVDNGSTDGSVGKVKKYPIEILRRKKNVYSLPVPVNMGIRRAIEHYDADYVCVMSNDAFLTDRLWLKKMLKVAKSDPKVGMVVCKMLYPNGNIQYAGTIMGVAPTGRGRGGPDKGQYDKIEESDGNNFTLCLIKSELIKKIGMLDPSFGFGSEDDDFSIRARKAGYKIMYDGKVSLLHLENYTQWSIKQRNVIERNFVYMVQYSYLYLAMKHYNLLKRLLAIGMAIGSAIFSIEDKVRDRRLTNLRLRKRPLWRVGITLEALFGAYGTWQKNKNKRELMLESR